MSGEQNKRGVPAFAADTALIARAVASCPGDARADLAALAACLVVRADEGRAGDAERAGVEDYVADVLNRGDPLGVRLTQDLHTPAGPAGASPLDSLR